MTLKTIVAAAVASAAIARPRKTLYDKMKKHGLDKVQFKD